MLQVLVNVFLENFQVLQKETCGYAKRKVVKKWKSIQVSKTMGT
jgi:hypothetical protein